MGESSDGLTDFELWQRVTRHDGAAFGVLFERHVDAVYNHCFRRTASWSTAEDLASIVWLEAWRRRKDVHIHNDSILPWLLATANNCLRNFNRSQRRNRRFLDRLPTTQPSIDFGDETAQRIDDYERMARVLSAVSDLRIEEQEVVALCDWASLSYEAAAVAIGKPVGTVKSRLSRAHEHLRGALIHHPGGGRIQVVPLAIQPLQEGGDH